LGIFGFDRIVYGNSRRKGSNNKKWRWYEELRQERIKDIQTEISKSSQAFQEKR
jgi:hypothetical protein